jgi:putative phosphoribosyl transferase
VTCLVEADSFFAVGQFYADFAPTPDDEVTDLLDRAALRTAPGRSVSSMGSVGSETPVSSGSSTTSARLSNSSDDVRKAAESARERDVVVPVGPVALPGRLTVPADAREIVVFVHGSGSSRFSPRNRAVAVELNRAGLATFLFDLLTPQEETDRANVFDVALLARRLAEVSRWLRRLPAVDSLPMAYFGASTGAAAALWASTEPDNDIASIVSRGGRPDLAAERLAAARAPTLLVVGGEDQVVLALNNQARTAMHGETQLAVVDGATHLFTEPGALKTVASLARDWFLSHLPVASSGGRH